MLLFMTESDQFLEQLWSGLIPRMLYFQGINSTNLHQYSDEDLQEIFKDPAKSRYWYQESIVFTSWEALLVLAERNLRLTDERQISEEIAAIGGIIIAYTALEECVNDFYIDCFRARNMPQAELLGRLNGPSLAAKLDGRLRALTGHSLKSDLPALWTIFDQAKSLRHRSVHNKLIEKTFAQEEASREPRIEIIAVAEAFVKSVADINVFLKSIYPSDVVELSDELKRIWLIAEKRLNFATLLSGSDVNLGRKPSS